MKKISFALIGLLFAMSTGLKADEGMWLLPLLQKLNIDTMHSLGLKLTAEQIYSINNSSLKDAIIIFGGGCTGEVVSDKGLVLTNHHCGYDAIQNHSTIEHNYLEDGFWAEDFKKELPNEKLSATFLVRVEDVTDKVLGTISDTMSNERRFERIAYVSDSISQAATTGNHYKAEVNDLFGGNNYYLFVYEIYEDVRLVGAPPSSIGKFGHDTDNWMWPRHTGDFSVFRIYSDKEGKPAKFNDDNVPYTPKHFLPVSMKDRNIGDYAMILGYPGNTTRYMTSFEIRELTTITNPNRIKIRGLRQDILMKDMRADEKVNIQYASKYSTSSNYWKYSIGQNQGLRKLNLIEKREKQEEAFKQWVNNDKTRIEKYGEALNLIKNAVEKRAIYTHNLQYTYECFFSASELIAIANRANGLYNTMLQEPGNKKLIDSLANLLKIRWEDFYKEYNPATDMKVIPAILKLYKENVAEEYLPEIYNTIQLKYKNDIDRFTTDLFSKSIFASQEKMMAFVANPNVKVLEKDPAFRTALSAMDVYRNAYFSESAYDTDFEKGHRLYVAGLMEMYPDNKFYPDANFTMRLTYGTVQDYKARDAVHYDYLTTLTGIMEKEDPSNWEFIVPEKLKTLYKNKDYGEYGVNGILPVCFITNNDITGGNSGSPVIDGEGNLIGLAFDGNWEAMSSNVAFEPELQRCICVDIRYVLFIIDKYAGANRLINEMKIVR